MFRSCKKDTGTKCRSEQWGHWATEYEDCGLYANKQTRRNSRKNNVKAYKLSFKGYSYAEA